VGEEETVPLLTRRAGMSAADTAAHLGRGRRHLYGYHCDAMKHDADSSMRGETRGAGLGQAAFSLLREVVGLGAEERERRLAGHDPEVVAMVRDLLDLDDDRMEPFAGGLPSLPSTIGTDAEIEPDADELGQLGPYRLLEVLGEGGMGRVDLARQSEPVERRVALKVISSKYLDEHTRDPRAGALLPEGGAVDGRRVAAADPGGAASAGGARRLGAVRRP